MRSKWVDESDTTKSQRKKAWAVLEIVVLDHVIRRFLVGEK